MTELRIPCSPDQEDVVVDHMLSGAALGMQPDERAWIMAHVRKHNSRARVLSADLDLETAEWVLQLQM